MELVERSTQLDDLARALDQAAQGRGRTVLLSGEAGIGKTSLLRAFADATASHARVFEGRCDELITPRVLGPFRDMARHHRGVFAGTRGRRPGRRHRRAHHRDEFPAAAGRGDRGGSALGRPRLARRRRRARPAGARPAGPAHRQLPRRRGARQPATEAAARVAGRPRDDPDPPRRAVRRGRCRSGRARPGSTRPRWPRPSAATRSISAR